MWLILLAISTTIVAGGLAPNHYCRLDIRDVCTVDEIPKSFPGSEAELNIFCNTLKTFLRCRISVKTRCQIQPESVTVKKKILRIVISVCNKHSQLHKDIIEKLECFKGFIENDTSPSCIIPQPDDKVLIDQVLMKLGKLSSRCIRNTYFLACYAVKLQRACGKNVFAEITANAAILFGTCGDKILELLPVAVNLYKWVEANESEREGFSTATTESFDDCKVPINETCIQDEIDLALPGPQERACKAKIDLIECTIQMELKCQFNPERLPLLIKDLELIQNVCGKDGNGNKVQETRDGNILESNEVVKLLLCMTPVAKKLGLNCTQRYEEESYSENLVRVFIIFYRSNSSRQ